jgi:hypothetical protein
MARQVEQSRSYIAARAAVMSYKMQEGSSAHSVGTSVKLEPLKSWQKPYPKLSVNPLFSMVDNACTNLISQ